MTASQQAIHQTLHMKPPTTIDQQSYPHLFEQILSYVSDWDALLALRIVSRHTSAAVDARIYSHLVVKSSPGDALFSSALSGSRGIPRPSLADDSTWSKRLTHLAILDVLGSRPPHTLSPLLQLSTGKLAAPNLRMIRRATPKAPDFGTAPTVVDMVDITRKFWGERTPTVWVNTRTKRVEKHVVVVRCDGGLWPIVSMAHTWDAKHVVFIFRRGAVDDARDLEQPSTFPASFVGPFLSLAVFHKRTRFTFVGLCDLEDEMLGMSRSEVHDAALALAKIRPANEEYHLVEKTSALPVEDRLEFLSSEEYAKSVGQETWALEKWDEAPVVSMGCAPACPHS